MTNAITPLDDQQRALANVEAERQTVIGTLADAASSAAAFEDYHRESPPNSQRRHRADLLLLTRYLVAIKFYTVSPTASADQQEAAIRQYADALYNDPAQWARFTFGIIDGFKRWQLQQGYALASINARLATVKRYAALAANADIIEADAAAKIATVKGYAYGKRANVDADRAAAGQPTRISSKKAKAVPLTKAQRAALKKQPDTPQGRRDQLLMCLLLDHGLRCGEIAALEVSAFTFDDERKTGYFTFYRPKVHKTQTHTLTPTSYRAARAYFENDAPAVGKLLRASLKSKDGDKLGAPGMSERAITKRVNYLGKKIGIMGLSAHDGRHSAATETANQDGVSLNRMVEMFGWNSPAMALTYIRAAARANEGVTFEDD